MSENETVFEQLRLEHGLLFETAYMDNPFPAYQLKLHSARE